MNIPGPQGRFVFPKWANVLRPFLAVALLGGPMYLVVFAYYGGSPRTTDVGYMPEQPIPYSHALHAGKLGMDCRYCHFTVERAGFAAIPPTQVCMNCHTKIRATSEKLAPLRASYATGRSVEWIKVHDLADFVYFNHSAHVRRGVGCVECHGRIDTMEVVHQVERLSMGWCLECHRNPDTHLRPPELVTQMDWNPPGGQTRADYGRKLRADNRINPPQDCSSCHR
jgi:hypothetical protein